MKYIYWNLRGMGNLDTQIHLAHMVTSHKPDFLFLAEPLVTPQHIPAWYWNRLNLQSGVIHNLTNTLWCIWNTHYNVNILHNSAQCMAFSYIYDNTLIHIAAVYASTLYTTRRTLWLDLSALLHDNHGPWLFVGDFNSILGAHERLEGRPPLQISCAEFRDWSNKNVLLHLETNGAKYTWTNKREGRAFMAQILDRAICNEQWLDHWNISSCNTLIKHHSDHFPLLITLNKTPPITIIPRFKFFNAWTEIDSCEALVAAHWLVPATGTPMHILHFKLKSLKPKLKDWNKNVVGDFHHRVQVAQQHLYEAQMAIDNLGFSVDRSLEELNCMTSYNQSLQLLNKFWKDKNKNAKFLEGDRNTAFFHRNAKIREAQSYVSLLKDGETVLNNLNDIEQHVLQYFTNIFSAPTSYVANDLPNRLIPSIVTEAENNMLTAIPLHDEIKGAILDLNGDSAPGPDGYSGHFFQHFWNIIGADVVRSTQYFFTHNYIMPNLNSNLLILIPKVPRADKLDNFRPIALANFQFKIITKILADRLGTIASRIISVHQKGFIPGRHIQDCIMTASEAVKLLHKKSFGGKIALKIDVKKAFDTINWSFLIQVLHCFGFNQTFCDWISTILHSAKLSVNINGKAIGYFTCTRGVRQGDPLSPLLFCIAEEVLSRGLSALVLEGKLTQMRASRNLYVPSHCLYADDILIFCSGTLANIRHIMKLFEVYGQYSGQIVNAQKSKFYSGAISLSRIHTISSITGFSHGSLPFTYLGIPLFKGKPKAIYLRPVVDRIQSKLHAWKGRILTLMGRVQLVNAVISSMLTYSFHVYKWPASLLSEVAKLMRNFIWSGNCTQQKLCTVSWAKVCQPKESAGLAVRDPAMVNKASLLLLSWQLLTSEEQWAHIGRTRFLNKHKPKNHHLTSSVWLGMKPHINYIISHSTWSVGNGRNISFWEDRWLEMSVAERWNIPSTLLPAIELQVADFIVQGRWCLPPYIRQKDPALADKILAITLPEEDIPDMLHWTLAADGTLTSKLAFHSLYGNS